MLATIDNDKESRGWMTKDVKGMHVHERNEAMEGQMEGQRMV